MMSVFHSKDCRFLLKSKTSKKKIQTFNYDNFHLMWQRDGLALRRFSPKLYRWQLKRVVVAFIELSRNLVMF